MEEPKVDNDHDTSTQPLRTMRISSCPSLKSIGEVNDENESALPRKDRRRNLFLKIVSAKPQLLTNQPMTTDTAGRTRTRRVIINVSGEIYETFARTLKRYPQTLLGDDEKFSKYYCPQRNVYQFYSNRNYFDAILFFFQSQGKLICPPNTDVQDFVDECLFFELPNEIVTETFKLELALFKEGVKHRNELNETKTMRAKCWNVLDKPASSRIANLYFSCSLVLTFVSILFACFQTNKTIRKTLEDINPKAWTISDLIFNIFFTTEFVIRFLSSPNKKSFFATFLNWIDFLCIASYFLHLSLHYMMSPFLVIFVHVSRIGKVFCLFRLSKTFKALRLSVSTVKLLTYEYTTLFFCFFMSFFSGATIIYFAEKHRDVFNAIPKCFFWAISTVTAVGDGYSIPNTTLGKFVASCYMFSGILTFTLPTIYIMNKFSPVYQQLYELSLT